MGQLFYENAQIHLAPVIKFYLDTINFFKTFFCVDQNTNVKERKIRENKSKLVLKKTGIETLHSESLKL